MLASSVGLAQLSPLPCIKSLIMSQAFAETPTLFKFIIAHSLMCFYFFIATVIPGVYIEYAGKLVEMHQIWELGLGVPVIILGLGMPLSGIMMLKKHKYSRHIYGANLFFGLVGCYIYLEIAVPIVFAIFLWAAVIGYIFLNARLKSYFRF